MTRRKKIYEGKAKILYEGPEPGTLIQYFKDDATAFNAQKKAVLDGKGVINNRISEYVMTRLNTIGIQNHFIKRLNLREQLIKEVEIIPLEVVCRNIAAGSLSTRLGIPEGQPLPRSIIEFYYKKDELNDPMVTEEHITAFNWASTQEIDDMLAMTLRVNDFLSGMFGAVGITLVDFKIEYGRLWDTITSEKLDKDRFRRDLGNVIESYTEVARRLGIMKEMPRVIDGGIS
jgi:phosphoribosylaminoimidazole-succinocarboxamide synthase